MDGEQIAERVLDYLERIGETLASLAPDARRIAMQAIYSDLVHLVFWVIGLLVVAIVLLWYGKSVRDYGREKDDADAIDVGYVVGFAGIIPMLALLVPLSGIVSILVSPEYHALLKVIDLVLNH